MANQVEELQGYVVDSAYKTGRTTLKDYITIQDRLFNKGSLNIHQVFMFMQTLIINAEVKEVRSFLEINPTIASNVQDTMDYGFVTEDGELTQHCIDTLTKEGYEVETKEVV